MFDTAGNNLSQKSILHLRSPDRVGILAGVTPMLAGVGCDIRDATMYGDDATGTFFVRMVLDSPEGSLKAVSEVVKHFCDKNKIEWQIYDQDMPLRVVIAVSKFDHCLLDLLHNWRIGTLPISIGAVVSNHEKLRVAVEAHGVMFYHLPMSSSGKADQEAQFEAIIDDVDAELIVLARYMQILSSDFTRKLSDRCINIHHSFLPSFKGAKPYHQAHQRGVKLIGATAHFVTPELDEGPIIEQDVRRVTHTTDIRDMIVLGREVEASVLTRAVKWYAERRIFLNKDKTVIL